jgi:hypothetical protein
MDCQKMHGVKLPIDGISLTAKALVLAYPITLGGGGWKLYQVGSQPALSLGGIGKPNRGFLPPPL